jgi:glycosyltransferase involved in cell wall biosynthesis
MEGSVVILAINSSTQDLKESIRSFKAAGVKNIMMFDSAKYGFVPVLDSSVRLFHTDEALVDAVEKAGGFVFVTRRMNAPRDFAKVVFVNGRKESDAYCLSGFKLMGPVDERLPNVEVEWWNRNPNAPRYLKNDSGNVEVDYFPDTGFLVHSSRFSELCKTGVLRVFDSNVRATMAFKDAGMRLVCMDSPWGRPVRLSVRNSGRKYLKPDERMAISKLIKNKTENCFDDTGVGNTMVTQCTADETAVSQSPPRGRTIVGLTSYPPREAGMLMVVDCISKQCDEMYVSLNEYEGDELERIRRILSKYENVHVDGYVGKDDLGCQNKFRRIGECRENDYFVSVDDDILYPSNYVEKMVSNLEEIGDDSFVSCHGWIMSFKNGRLDMDSPRKSHFIYSNGVTRFHRVHLCGCGVGICKPKKIGLTFDLFNKPKNSGDDELLAVWAHKNSIKLFVCPHEERWLRANSPVEHTNALWRNKESRARRMEWLHSEYIEEEENKPMVPNRERAFFRIVIPVYRSCETLRRALKSIKEQTFEGTVVAVVDDASPKDDADKNERSVSEILGDRGEFVHLNEHAYAGGARNKGMELFKDTSYTLFLDADDEFVSCNTLAELHSFIEDKGFPDVVMLPFIRDGRTDIIKRMSVVTSPKALAETPFVTPWSKCTKTSMEQPFDSGLRRSNDVSQHYRVADSVKTVVPYNKEVVRYNVDGETTMFGNSRESNEKSIKALSSLFSVAGILLSTKWKHEYVRKPIANQVLYILYKMIPSAITKYPGKDISNYIEISETK